MKIPATINSFLGDILGPLRLPDTRELAVLWQVTDYRS